MNHNPRMVTNTYSKWGVRLGTLALWAAAGASVVFWGLRLSAPAAGAAAPVVLPPPVAPDAQALARLLGAAPAAPGVVAAAPVATLASRFALIGVLSGRNSGGGAALIAVIVFSPDGITGAAERALRRFAARRQPAAATAASGEHA